MKTTRTYLFTFKEEGDKMEMVVEAKHKEEARAIFKKQIGNVPLNYRIKEIKKEKQNE